MSLDRLMDHPPMGAVMIGNESLLVQCATLWRDMGHTLAAVVTRAPNISDWAEAEGLRVLAADHDWAAALTGEAFEWLLSVANLDMLPQAVLDLPTKGAVNFHDGPLPRYAGLNAPVWARLHQEPRHGITWHSMEAGADTGKIVAQRLFDVTESDTALTLNTKCYAAAMESFPDVVRALAAGLPDTTAQDMSARSYFGRSARPEAGGRLDFTQSAEANIAWVRALDHGDYFNPLWAPKIAIGDRILIVKAAERAENPSAAPAGTVLHSDSQSLTVACGKAAVRLSEISDLEGAAVDLRALLSAGLSHGEPLSSLDADTREAWTTAMSAVARAEPFWRARLAEFAPAALPLIHSADPEGAPDIQSLPLDLPKTSAQRVLTAVALWALRSGVADATDLAYRGPSLHGTALISPWVPLRLSAEHLAADLATAEAALHAQITEADQQGGFARDLLARDPALSPLKVPDVALHLEAGPVPGAAVTVSVSAEGAVLYYDAARLEPPQANRMAARLEHIAAQLATTTTLAEIDTLSAAERAEILTGFNTTEVPFDPDLTLVAQFEAQVAQSPEAPALVFGHEVLSYGDLEARANRTAHVLRNMGVGPGTLVGLCLRRSTDLVVAALGILKAGGAYLPLDPAYPAERLAHYIADSGCGVIVTQVSLSQELPPHQAQLLEIDTEPRLSTAPEAAPALCARGDDLAYLIYTSGSTGTPKGVMVTHGNVANFFAGMDARIPYQAGDAWMALTSLSFDISVLELFWTLSRGFKLVLAGDDTTTQISHGRLPKAKGGMEFSLYYWGNDDGAGPKKYELLLEGAKFADANGFSAVWTPERHFHAFGGPYPNPSVTGAAVAAVTSRIGVRAGSCVAPLHHTARIAEEWAVIDNLTNGRAGLAVASGWQPDDFVLRPENTPPANKPAMFEQMQALRQLWRGEAVAFPKQDGSLHEVVTQPRPVSKELPVWITTAGNPDTWVEAGRNGCHVLTHLLGQSIEEVADKITLYHAALRAAGHDPKNFNVTLMLHSFLAADRDTAREIAREPMKDYLRSAAGLIKQYAWAFPAFKRPEGVDNAFQLDLGSLTEEELEGILDFAFLRYFEDSGLFGTVEDALDRVEQVKRIGVTEIACLIDYGIAPATVLEGLKPLAEVLRRANAEGELDPEDTSIAAQMLRHEVSHLQCTPSMAHLLAGNEEARFALGQLRQMMIGGEALSGALVTDLRAATDADIQNMYGPTETTIWSTTAQAQIGEGIANIGTPIANTRLYVVDDTGAPVPVGVPGELLIGGAGVTRGYWQREALTAERFVASPLDAGPVYKTGDLVRWRADGKLDFLGRVDHQVKLRGYRIELGEIETRLEEITGIAQAVVMAREDTPGDVRLVAYLRGDVPTEAQIRATLRDNLPAFMCPQHYVTLAAFPLTPNKKVDRKALPAPQAQSVTQATDPAAPRPKATAAMAQRKATRSAEKGDMAGLVTEVWRNVLGVAEIHGNDNFFDLGGHSLLAVQAHREIRDRAGVAQLSITDVFRFPTLAALAARIEALAGDTAPQQARAAAPPKSTSEPLGNSRADIMRKRREMRARRQARVS